MGAPVYNIHSPSAANSILLYMLNKNTLGVKKCEVNQKQHPSRQVRPNTLISAEAKKLLNQKTFNPLNDIQYFIVYFSRLALSLGHLYNNFGTKRWPSDKPIVKNML